jgi:hypothetical protein
MKSEPGPFTYRPIIEELLEQFFPQSETDIRCDAIFENQPMTSGIVDASPVFIRRLSGHSNKYYLGKFKRHSLKVQVFKTAGG